MPHRKATISELRKYDNPEDKANSPYDVLLPLTATDAVYDEDGISLTERLSHIKSENNSLSDIGISDGGLSSSDLKDNIVTIINAMDAAGTGVDELSLLITPSGTSKLSALVQRETGKAPPCLLCIGRIKEPTIANCVIELRYPDGAEYECLFGTTFLHWHCCGDPSFMSSPLTIPGETSPAWTEDASGGYKCTVSYSGARAWMEPSVELVLSQNNATALTQAKAWAYVDEVVVADGAVSVRCLRKKPGTDISVVFGF